MSGAIPLFVISLDFELYWGIRDVATLAQAKDRLLGERVAVGAILDLFRQRSIRATWATVGALFCRSKKELLASLPDQVPRYEDTTLSPYERLNELGASETADPFHFAPSLIDKIAGTPGQELASHTFSHYYCLERGQNDADFESDLVAARRAGASYGDVVRSLVFPRNQFNPDYMPVLRRQGVKAFRSNGNHWAYRAQTSVEPAHRRIFRLGDSYLPLSGKRSRRLARTPGEPIDVPASAFLRPYHPKLRILDHAKHHRLTSAMRASARNGECFHLWWHPSNFGSHLRENLAFLTAVIDSFDELRRTLGMESATMVEAAGDSLTPYRSRDS